MSTAFQNSKHFPGELIVRMMQGAKYVRNDSYTSPYTLPTMSSPSILVLSIIFTSIQYNKKSYDDHKAPFSSSPKHKIHPNI